MVILSLLAFISKILLTDNRMFTLKVFHIMNDKNKNFLPMISKIVDEDKEYLIDILSKLVTYDSTIEMN